uniref:Uncharacterized protein n=1 Tax=Solanum tuberosum TaxID=4113 RepID=M1CR68_SOLTU
MTCLYICANLLHPGYIPPSTHQHSRVAVYKLLPSTGGYLFLYQSLNPRVIVSILENGDCNTRGSKDCIETSVLEEKV